MGSGNAGDVSWAVVNNGLDFLQRAVEELAKPSESKYATIHLFAAIEVLIKARLIHEHWTLACEKADGATLAGLEAGTVFTVDAMKGLKRLQSNLGLTISQAQINNVEAVRRLRNRVAHFAIVNEDEVATRAELARGLDFVLWFLQKHIEPDAPADESELIAEVLDELTEALTDVQQFVAERLARLKGDLDAAELLLTCPHCSQDTLEVADAAPHCLFCEWNSDGEGGADAYVESVLNTSHYVVAKDGGEWPVHSCPQCDVPALVHGVEIITDASSAQSDINDPYVAPDFVCFNCGYEGTRLELDRCGRCGEWTTSGMGVCDSCFAYAVGAD